MGVYFRKESTIPLDRITDIKLYDDPLMRFYGLRAIRVETAGQSGANASSEGNLIGIVDAVEFRDAILRQRELLMEGAPTPTAAPPTAHSGHNRRRRAANRNPRPAQEHRFEDEPVGVGGLAAPCWQRRSRTISV